MDISAEVNLIIRAMILRRTRIKTRIQRIRKIIRTCIEGVQDEDNNKNENGDKDENGIKDENGNKE